MKKNYYFDGGLLELILLKIAGVLITIFTLGICYPWAITMIYSYQAKHTVLDGRRLRFKGTAIGLFGQWIKWALLSVITLGIYSWWIPISLKKWKTKNLVFEDSIYLSNNYSKSINSNLGTNTNYGANQNYNTNSSAKPYSNGINSESKLIHEEKLMDFINIRTFIGLENAVSLYIVANILIILKVFTRPGNFFNKLVELILYLVFGAIIYKVAIFVFNIYKNLESSNR